METMSLGMGILSPAPYGWGSDWAPRQGGCWTAEENKIFERALAIYDGETPERWARVAEMLSGKTVDDVRRHYRELEDDVQHIEAGLVPIPGYSSSSFTVDWGADQVLDGMPHWKRACGSRPEHDLKKGVPWTEEEHRLFLMGLNKYGKGDWRNISRNFVLTRTPTQVASHAQKYFIRLSSGGKDKRRSSIHDITTASLAGRESHPSFSSSPDVSEQSHSSMAQPQTEAAEAATFG